MQSQILKHLKTLFFLLIFTNGYTQGCSDAGFCTMGAMKPDQSFVKKGNIKLRAIDLNQYLGRSRFNDFINVTNLEANFSSFEDVNLQVKIPYFFVNGPLGTTNGVGDISLSATKPIVSKKSYSINYTLGAKIPTNKSNKSVGDADLPMYYQTSLGTFDFVTGVSLITKGWLFATGYQQVIYNINQNNFFWGPWKEQNLFEVAMEYPASVELERGKDIMFRVEKNFTYSKFNFYLGLLDVWRLNKDVVTNPGTGERMFVENDLGTSNGHALTFLTGFGYNFSVKSSLKIMFGQRLIKRHYNPDGLSREQVSSFGYQYKF